MSIYNGYLPAVHILKEKIFMTDRGAITAAFLTQNKHFHYLPYQNYASVGRVKGNPVNCQQNSSLYAVCMWLTSLSIQHIQVFQQRQ